MERIRQAIERAKGSGIADAPPSQPLPTSGLPHPQFHPSSSPADALQMWGNEVRLDPAYLEAHRIIAHDVSDPLTRSFDMLRTQVVQPMQMNSWQILGVTSPNAGCGKSVVSINLALSIARQQNRAVLLVDTDLQRPQIAPYLGIKCKEGLLSVLAEKTDLSDAIIRARISDERICVLPCEAATANSSEWMASPSMANLVQEIKRNFKDWTVIFDLPPVLLGDDVITILPQIDCCLFVVAAGMTTISEIKESNKHLESTNVVRVVLNKSTEIPSTYYSRYVEQHPRNRH